MGNWLRITAIMTLKDLQFLSTDKGALTVLFLLPLLFSLVIGAPLQMAGRMSGSSDGEQSAAITTLVVNEDKGSYGAQIVVALEEVALLNVAEAIGRADADDQVAGGEAPAAVVIPGDFSAKIDAGQPTSIQVIIDPTQDELGGIVKAIVTQAATEAAIIGEIRLGVRSVLDRSDVLSESSEEFRRATEAQTTGAIWAQVLEARRSPLITVAEEDLEGEIASDDWNVFSYYAPSFGVMFAFFLTAFMAGALLVEREQGTLARLLVSPVPPSTLVGGKVAAYGIIVFLQMIVMFGVGAIAFGMPMGNSPFGLVLTTLGLALAATSLGVMIGALAKDSDSAGNIGTLLAFILMAVGGCLFPIFRTGGIVSVVSYLTPHAHALTVYMGLMADGAPLGELWLHIVALFGFATVFSAIAVWRSRT